MLRRTGDDILDTIDDLDRPEDGAWAGPLGGNAGGEAGEDAGNALASFPGSPTGSAPSRFWRGGADARAGTAQAPPLLPGREERSGAAEGFRPLKERLAEQFPLRAEELEWRLLTEPLAAADEQDALLREASERSAARRSRDAAEDRALAEELGRMRAEQAEAIRALAAVREEFGDALAQADLAWVDGEACPAAVEAALQDAAPDLEELAGEQGMAPPAGGSRTSPVEVLACVASGLVLGTSMGTLLGVLSLNDIQRSDRLPAILAAVLIGGATSGALGELVACAAGSLARALRRGGPEVVRPRNALAAALALCALAACLLAAEVGAEAVGMRELHLQSVQAAQRVESAAAEANLLPVWAYLLFGALVSGPYLVGKAAKSWAEHGARVEVAWLWARQHQWLQQRRASEEVRRAFALAARAEGLAESAEALERRIAALEARRDSLLEGDGFDAETRMLLNQARAAAAGLSSAFRQQVSGLVDEVEPLPRKRRGLFG